MLSALYKQVTGTVVGYQIQMAKNALMLNIGGSATTRYVSYKDIKSLMSLQLTYFVEERI